MNRTDHLKGTRRTTMSHRILFALLITCAAMLVPSHADAAPDYVVWGQYNSGLIRRVNADGTGATTIATGQSQVWSLTVDRANERVYWITLGGNVRGVNYDGTGLIDIQTLDF